MKADISRAKCQPSCLLDGLVALIPNPGYEVACMVVNRDCTTFIT